MRIAGAMPVFAKTVGDDCLSMAYSAIAISRTDVRPATRADVPAIASMKKDWASEDGSAQLISASEQEWAHHLFGAAPHFSTLLAEQCGEILGMLIYCRRFIPGWAEPVIDVIDVYIKPAYRRNKVATVLLREVGRIALRDGIQLLKLTVHRDNPARLLYSSAGFEHVPEALTYMIAGTNLHGLVQKPDPLEIQSGVRPAPAGPGS